jgi:hypothetical protein
VATTPPHSDRWYEDRAQQEWTVATLKAYTEAKERWEARFEHERDRRYAEVALEREKALKIKEEADKAALGLAREIQTYKDEKANDLRSQIERERGDYPTRPELTAAVEKIEQAIKPLAAFTSSEQGRSAGTTSTQTFVLGLLITLATIAAAVSPHIH